MIAYIDAHRDRFGVEPICNALQFAPSTYWSAKRRPPCARGIGDEQLCGEIARVHAENFGVYGADKVWAQLKREGIRVARCTVERLMRRLGLRGVVRGKTSIRTTIGDGASDRPLDLVARQCPAPAPHRLWVADLTTSSPTAVGSMSRSSWMSARASSSAGRHPGRCGPTWRSTPWRWRAGHAEPRSSRGSSTRATEAHRTWPSGRPSA